MPHRATIMVPDRKHVAYNYWTDGGYQTGHMLVPILNTMFTLSTGKLDFHFEAQFGSPDTDVWCENDYSPIEFADPIELGRIAGRVRAFVCHFGKKYLCPHHVSQVLSRVWIPPNERIVPRENPYLQRNNRVYHDLIQFAQAA